MRLRGQPEANRAGLHGSLRDGETGEGGQGSKATAKSRGQASGEPPLPRLPCVKLTATGLRSDTNRTPRLVAGASVTRWTVSTILSGRPSSDDSDAVTVRKAREEPPPANSLHVVSGRKLKTRLRGCLAGSRLAPRGGPQAHAEPLLPEPVLRRRFSETNLTCRRNPTVSSGMLQLTGKLFERKKKIET